MPPSEYIDLSLSTDDEAPLRPSPGHGGKTASQARVATGFRHFENDLDLGESWTTHASKRRKLSPPSDVEKGRLEVGSAVLGSRKSTTRTTQEDRWTEEPSPIISTSQDRDSAPLRGYRSAVEPATLITDDSDDSFPEDVINGRIPEHKQRPLLSERTAALLASLDKPMKRKKIKAVGQRSSDKTRESRKLDSPCSGDEETDLERAPNPKVAKSSTTAKLKNAEKAARAEEREHLRKADKARKVKDREEEQEQKRLLKEEEQERKRLLKEERTREKQKDAALAEVNKSKLDKKVTGPEMIVDLPATIDGYGVDIQIREFLKNLQIEATSYQSPLPNIIKWRRKVKSRYSEEKGHWEPTQSMEIEDEKHVMCLMSAQEFVALASAKSHQQDVQSVEVHVAKFKSEFNGCKPIYLIEGLTSWMRKNKTTLNRAYQAAVLNQMDGLEDSAPGGSQKATSRRKKSAQEHVDPDMIEDALLRLQVMNGCLVHHTAIPVETAEWVANFTQHISTIPSRMERMNLDTSFCMESGQVKTGDDKSDTYVKMLQEVVRVTAPIAYGIAAEYPNVISLVRGLRRRGPLALEDIEKCANRDGARTERRIGPAISKRIYKVFMDLDPSSTDI